MYADFVIELKMKSFLIKERAKPGYKNILSWLRKSVTFFNLLYDKNKGNKFCTKYN